MKNCSIKYILFIITGFYIITSCGVSKPYDSERMTEKSRNKYFIKLGKEVTLAFGPEYYVEIE